jgi:putative phage-type endonuclease
MEQRTPEWHEARLGRVTASRIGDVMARTKAGYGASRANYMAQLVAERLTGRQAEMFVSAAMLHGTEKEAEARECYSFYCGLPVVEEGFVPHPTIEMAGASPDGLVADEGLVEIKCPNTATHIETLLNGAVPEKYLTQMFWQMACTERRWCDFVSYDPRLPEEMRLFVKRVEHDAERIAELEAEVAAFIDELNSKVDNLRAQYSPAPPVLSAINAG